MTLKDLKTGMIVTLRNGLQYTVMRDIVYNKFTESDILIYSNFDQSKCLNYYDECKGYMGFNRYHDDLTHITSDRSHRSEWDIVKVETAYHPYGFMDLTYNPNGRSTVWKEPPVVKLTVSEIEDRLGYKVEIVSEEE